MTKLPPSPPESDSGANADMEMAAAMTRTPPTTTFPSTSMPSLLPQVGSSSGSYLFAILAAAWSDHLSTLPPGSPQPALDVKTIRNADYTEYVLRDAAGSVLFRGATTYGFRNLQNLVRKLQKQTGLKSKGASAGIVDPLSRIGGASSSRGSNRVKGKGMTRRGAPMRAGTHAGAPVATLVSAEDEGGYDYVEVMACPGGCVNGGGQLRPPASSTPSARHEQSDAQATSIVARTLQAQNDAAEMQVDQWEAGQGKKSGYDTPDTDGLSLAAGRKDDFAMDLDQVPDEEPVKGWQGTSREWVRLVEKAYWLREDAGALEEQLSLGSAHAVQAFVKDGQTIGTRYLSDTVSQALRDYVSSRPTDSSQTLASTTHRYEAALRSLNGNAGEENFLTQYRAVQDEAVSGLAVQW